MMMITRLGRQTKNHWIITLLVWTLWFVNYISIKLLFLKKKKRAILNVSGQTAMKWKT